MITYPSIVDGKQTRIVQGGSNGPVVILLHGLSARADRWHKNLDALGALGVRAMAVDLPGHGLASKGADFDYSASGYSSWLEKLVRSLKVEQVVLIGTSFGGLVAGAYAADFPHRVAGLMAVGAIGLVPAGRERREKTMAWLPQMAREHIRERLSRGVRDPALISDALVEEDWHINNSAGAAEAFRKLSDYYRDRIDDDAVAPRLAGLANRFPIRLVWGEADVSVSPEYGVKAQALIPGATLQLVPESGHFPYWEQPDAFNAIATAFLKECLADIRTH